MHVLVLFVVVFSVGFLTLRGVHSLHVLQTEKNLKSNALLAAEHLKDLTQTLSPAVVDSLCDQLGEKTGIRFTVIIPSGLVAGDSKKDPETMENHKNRPEIIEAMQGNVGSASRYSRTIKRHMMYVATPVMKNGQILGVMRTSLPLTFVEQTVGNLKKELIFWLLSILAVAAIISAATSNSTTRPVKHMQEAAHKLANRNFDIRLPSFSIREFAGLAESIEQMAADLDHQIKEVSRQRNEREAMLASMNEGVVALNRDEQVVFANKVARRMLDIKKKDINSEKNIRELVRNTNLFELLESISETKQTKECDLSLLSSPDRILRVRGARLLNAEDADIGLLIVMDDVTKSRHLEKVRKDFVSNVSHELRTPITSIAGFVETLLDGAINEKAEAERFLKIIAKQTENLKAMVEDLLMLSRLEAPEEQRALSLSEIPLCDIVSNAIEACEAIATQRNVKIQMNCEGDTTHPVHKGLMEQAVVNLIDNAIKASDEEQVVNVTVSEKEKELVITVKDDGYGIPAKHIPRIFERFTRVDKGRSRQQGGTGLGLSIVKHIVNLHGGRIYVDSSPGRGSIFSIHLPDQIKSARSMDPA